jgi:hypothetical protein
MDAGGSVYRPHAYLDVGAVRPDELAYKNPVPGTCSSDTRALE